MPEEVPTAEAVETPLAGNPAPPPSTEHVLYSLALAIALPLYALPLSSTNPSTDCMGEKGGTPPDEAMEAYFVAKRTICGGVPKPAHDQRNSNWQVTKHDSPVSSPKRSALGLPRECIELNSATPELGSTGQESNRSHCRLRCIISIVHVRQDAITCIHTLHTYLHTFIHTYMRTHIRPY